MCIGIRALGIYSFVFIVFAEASEREAPFVSNELRTRALSEGVFPLCEGIF